MVNFLRTFENFPMETELFVSLRFLFLRCFFKIFALKWPFFLPKMHHNKKKISSVVPIGPTGKFYSKIRKFPKFGSLHNKFLATGLGKSIRFG
jgi:hypothetical protein